MQKKTISFIATRYRSGPVRVSFYTRKGGRVIFTGTKVVPVKEKIRFRTKVRN